MKSLPRHLPATLLLVLLARLATAQINVFSGIPLGQHPVRDREGGGEFVPIDTRTPLPDLIRRLDKKWHFVATGRGTIGYTDDMYSIAAHGEAAIAPLLQVVRCSPLKQAREGAVHCLHLIGIGSRVGNVYEDFTSRPARQALRSLLSDARVRATVVELLLHDPWQSDVPVLLAALAQTTPPDYVLTNATTHYRLASLPIGQPIPDTIGNQPLPLLGLRWESGMLVGGREQARAALLAIRRMQPPHIAIEAGLEDQPVESYLLKETIVNDQDVFVDVQPGRCIRQYLQALTDTDPNTFLIPPGVGTALQYYVNDKGLTVCSTATARQRVLAWWQAQPTAYRQQFSADKAK